MKNFISRTMRNFTLVALSMVALFVFTHTANAGTLTSFSYSGTDYTAGATANYTFNYTLETANPNMILYVSWPAGFDLSGSSAAVTINDASAPVGEYWNGGGSGNAYIRLTDPTAPTGAEISVTISNVVNPSSIGTYNFSFIKTADSGGGPVDVPITIDSIVVHEVIIPFTGEGSGTMETPFLVTTCEQLQEMKNHLSSVFMLQNDIDCSGTATWNVNLNEWVDGDINNPLIPDSYPIVVNNGYSGFEPIGNPDTSFTGKLFGNGHSIDDLWIFRKETNYVGLFGNTVGAEITGVTLNNPRIVGHSFVGGFVGYMQNTTLSSLVNNEGSVRAYLSYYGGGIIGLLDSGTVTSVEVIGGAVHGSGNIIGGVAGLMNDGTIADSSSSADIDGGELIGGFVGSMLGGEISGSVATGSVISNSSENNFAFIVKSGQYSGGFVGIMEGGLINDSHATGQVTAETDYAGGFVGTIRGANSEISDSYATGLTSGRSVVGGFAGQINEEATVLNSYATGTVTAIGDSVGGFAGQAGCRSIINYSYATGSVTGNDFVGGFSGADGCEGPGSTMNEVFATGAVLGNEYVGGFIGQPFTTTITDAYAGGNVQGSMKVGGFAGGVSGGAFTNTYSRGSVQAGTAFSAFIGEVLYDNPPTIDNSFFDNETAMAGSMNGGTAKTTTEMKTRSTFTDAGWNFETTWGINGTDNSGYPFFQYQGFTTGPTLDLTLTQITQIPSQVTAANAIYYFSASSDIDTALANETGQYIAEAPTNCAHCEIVITPSNHTLSFTGLQVGDVLEFNFGFETQTQSANMLHVGPFTVIAPSSSPSSGYSSLLAWNPTTTENQKNSCPANQLLTQNLKAPARNGIYNKYTKGIVKEVTILQAHMNRLGFNAGKEDGILGKITEGAIKRMQTYLGTKADGFVGPKTRELINNSCGVTGLQKN